MFTNDLRVKSTKWEWPITHDFKGNPSNGRLWHLKGWPASQSGNGRCEFHLRLCGWEYNGGSVIVRGEVTIETFAWSHLTRLLYLKPHEESCLCKPHRLRWRIGWDDSWRYLGYLLMFATPSIGVRPASLLVNALLSSFCDSVRKSCAYHFVLVNLHSYYALRACIKMFISFFAF